MENKDYKPTLEEFYRNDNIKIDFPLSKPLQELVDTLDRLYEQGDDLLYNMYVTNLNGYCKSAVLEGMMSEVQCSKLFNRYGTW